MSGAHHGPGTGARPGGTSHAGGTTHSGHDGHHRHAPLPDAPEDFWENHYTNTVDRSWGTSANALLVDVLTSLDLTPGRALDLGCGHGGDALWLAGLGWDVTAVDISTTALSRVDADARAAGLSDRVHTERHDLAESMPAGPFDLVNACYFQTPLEMPRDEILRRAAATVADGGYVLVVEHGSVPPWSGHPDAEFPTVEESLTGIGLGLGRAGAADRADDSVAGDGGTAGDGWRVERAEALARVVHGPDDQSATVTDNVVLLRRVGR